MVPKARAANPRGEGERLRQDMLDAAMSVIAANGEAETLSLRAVAREVGVAATSVYLHFPDRDALVTAVIAECFIRLMGAVTTAEDAARGPAAKLRARVLAHAAWASTNLALYKVFSESTLHARKSLSFLQDGANGTTEAVRRCIDAGLAPKEDANEVALDLRTAVHGMIAMRIDYPHLAWPPAEEQVDRFLEKLVGLKKKRRR